MKHQRALLLTGSAIGLLMLSSPSYANHPGAAPPSGGGSIGGLAAGSGAPGSLSERAVVGIAVGAGGPEAAGLASIYGSGMVADTLVLEAALLGTLGSGSPRVGLQGQLGARMMAPPGVVRPFVEVGASGSVGRTVPASLAGGRLRLGAGGMLQRGRWFATVRLGAVVAAELSEPHIKTPMSVTPGGSLEQEVTLGLRVTDPGGLPSLSLFLSATAEEGIAGPVAGAVGLTTSLVARSEIDHRFRIVATVSARPVGGPFAVWGLVGVELGFGRRWILPDCACLLHDGDTPDASTP